MRVAPSKESIIKVKTPTPDPQIGQASLNQIALSKQEYQDQKALLDQYMPLFQQQVASNTAAQQQETQQAADQYANYRKYFQPLEGQYATEAADYATDGRKEQAAQTAEGQVGTAFDTARAQQADQLQAGGVQAGSGKALALNNALNLQEATAKAGAANAARTNVENTGLNLQGSAVNIGRGLPTASLQAAGAAQSSGQAAQGSVSGASGLTAAPLTTSTPAFGAGVNGLIGFNQLQQGAASANQGFFGDLIGAGAMAYGMHGGTATSTKTAKTKISRVDGKAALEGLVAGGAPAAKQTVKAKPSTLRVSGPKALEGLTNGKMPVDGWKYHKGVEDSGDHVGPYAEDVHAAFGDAVAPRGKAIDMGAMSEVNGKAIAQLAKQVAAMKRELAALA
jgi:hypothetical protein